MTIDETHRRYYELMLRHGTADERAVAEKELRLLREFKTVFDGSTWGPLEEVVLPSFLLRRADRVARARHERAERWALANRAGATRSFADEQRVTRAQYAACLMVGVDFADVPRTHSSARAHGNIGGNRSVVIPREGSFGMLIGDKEPAARKMILVYEVGDHRYRCAGWIRAGEAQRAEFQRTFVRNGVTSKPYVVPTEQLQPLVDLFA